MILNVEVISIADTSNSDIRVIKTHSGGTTLYTEAYPASHRLAAQALMDRWVMGTMTVTSFSSGALVTTGGWSAMNLGALAPLALLAAALGWLARSRGPVAPATTP